MQEIFDEWCIYAGKKKFLDRDLDYERLLKNSVLKIVSITGMRRVGKTSILILLYNLLVSKDEKVAYINLDDSRIKNNPEVLDNILKWFGDEGYLLLDEITNAKDWAGWLARNHEMLKGKLKIIVSSSRSNLVFPTKELRGRILSYEIYPLSFKEFLKFKNFRIENTTAGIGKIERYLQDYLVYGGFPESVLLDDATDKVNLLNSYFRDIVGLDVAEISGEVVSTVETFGKYILETPYFSASKCLNFFKSLGYKISKQSILNLEKYSQESYLFFYISIYSKSIKNRSQYSRKSYLGDTGFMYSSSGRRDFGRLLENLVFLELKRRLPKNKEVNYWKDRNEVETDFVVREGTSSKEIIQVVYDLSEEKTKFREIKGLVCCAKSLNSKKGIIITKDFEDNQNIDGIEIKFIPIWKWLLESELRI